MPVDTKITEGRPVDTKITEGKLVDAKVPEAKLENAKGLGEKEPTDIKDSETTVIKVAPANEPDPVLDELPRVISLKIPETVPFSDSDVQLPPISGKRRPSLRLKVLSPAEPKKIARTSTPKRLKSPAGIRKADEKVQPRRKQSNPVLGLIRDLRDPREPRDIDEDSTAAGMVRKKTNTMEIESCFTFSVGTYKASHATPLGDEVRAMTQEINSINNRHELLDGSLTEIRRALGELAELIKKKNTNAHKKSRKTNTNVHTEQQLTIMEEPQLNYFYNESQPVNNDE